MTSQRRTRLPAAERRETILHAATEVFAQAGYRAAKVSDVAARTGVTEPVIFQNFGSKAALFAAVLERAAAEIRASLDDLTGGHGPASGLLSHILSQPPAGPPSQAAPSQAAPSQAAPGQAAPSQAAPSQAAPGLAASGQTAAGPDAPHAPHPAAAYGVLFADAAALAAEPSLAGPARDAFRAVATHLADLIRHAQDAGDIGRDTDPLAAAWLLLSILSARPLRAAAMPVSLEPAVAELALRALSRPAGRAAPPPR